MKYSEALEKQLEDARAAIELRDTALKLYENRDFKQVILDGFCTTDCARHAQLSADPSLNAEQRADSLGLAQAAGHVRRYLSAVVQMGNAAENSLPALHDELDAARAEE